MKQLQDLVVDARRQAARAVAVAVAAAVAVDGGCLVRRAVAWTRSG
jgi:hypothetical protein